ncbi:MAG: response regulator [Pseudomonadota bacterium]|nr:response regulator [Pseudomonadota bacterium]
MSKTLQILVVDDNIDAATTVVWLLESMGYENCTVAHDGPTALDIARELQPDVILLDLGLPGMNGYEVCRELRRNPMFADTLIIAQTGWGEERNREMAYFAGFNHHFVKPLKPEDLAGLLAKVPARKTPPKKKGKSTKDGEE